MVSSASSGFSPITRQLIKIHDPFLNRRQPGETEIAEAIGASERVGVPAYLASPHVTLLSVYA